MPKLVAPRAKAITLRPIQPNAGMRARYDATLRKWIAAMCKSVEYWLLATYKANPPEVIAMDARLPARALKAALKKLSDRWIGNFDKLAPELARGVADGSLKHGDAAMMALLRKRGFTVRFQMPKAMADILAATIEENQTLIKDIPRKYFVGINSALTEAITNGFDQSVIFNKMREVEGVTVRRAATISRDQINKANAVITRVRQQSLGMTQARWRHSGAGQHPRPSHVKANGTVYNIAEGCKIDGEFIWPGQLINCRCTAEAIIPGFDDTDD